jgi:hypothetical protein
LGLLLLLLLLLLQRLVLLVGVSCASLTEGWYGLLSASGLQLLQLLLTPRLLLTLLLLVVLYAVCGSVKQ